MTFPRLSYTLGPPTPLYLQLSHMCDITLVLQGIPLCLLSLPSPHITLMHFLCALPPLQECIPAPPRVKQS